MASFNVGEAPWEKEERTANSARPSDIKSPVPKEETLAVTAPDTSSFDVGSAPWETQAEIPEEPQFEPEPETVIGRFVKGNIDQFSMFTDRLRAGLGANDTEKLGFLKNKYGENNALMKDGKIHFRRSEGEKFKKFDPETFELLNDIVADFSREIVQEASMVPGEVGGAIMGSAVAPGVGTAGGVALGRAASTPMANANADALARAAGVPFDPQRNQRTENIMGMGIEAVLPPVAGKVIGAIAKRLPGTAAYKLAKEAGKKEVIALSEQSNEVAKAVQFLESEGRAARIDGAAVGVPGANVSLMGHHLNPDNPALQGLADTAASSPKFINAQTQLAQDWGASLQNTLTEIGRRNNPGPYKPEKLAEAVTNAVFEVEKAEGKAIGQFKAKALVELKNERLPLNQQTVENVTGLLNQFGFRPALKEQRTVLRKGAKGVVPGQPTLSQGKQVTSKVMQEWRQPKDVKSLVGKMGLTSPGEIRAVTNQLNELAKGLENGMTIGRLEEVRNTIGALSQRLRGTQAGAAMGKLSKDLRQTYRQGIEAGLTDPFERKAFNEAMDEFTLIKGNIETLKGALDSEQSAKAIVKNIFTGKENLQKVKAIKKLSPESFAGLKEEWINQMLIDFSSRESKTGFKSGAFLDAIDKKYGKEFVHEVLNDGPGPGMETVRKLLMVNERIESQLKNKKVDQLSEGQKKSVMDILVGLVGGIKFKTTNGLSSLFTGMGKEEKALMEIMTRDGIDKYVASYPGKIDKQKVSSQLHDMLAQYRIMRMSYPKAAKGVDAAGSVLKRGAKREIINEGQVRE